MMNMNTKTTTTINGRPLTVRLQNSRGRKVSSQRWLQRHLNDPYVSQAKQLGYRSRAALKLTEINHKYNFLTAGKRVIDLGAAPGGWTQVVVGKVGPKGQVIAVDLVQIDPIAGATMLCLDFLAPKAPDQIKAELNGEKADVILSDMAPSTSGHRQTDHLRIMALAEGAFDFALETLAKDGVLITKILQGGTEKAFINQLKQCFKKVKLVKPQSSHKDSAEIYILAQGFQNQSGRMVLQ